MVKLFAFSLLAPGSYLHSKIVAGPSIFFTFHLKAAVFVQLEFIGLTDLLFGWTGELPPHNSS